MEVIGARATPVPFTYGTIAFWLGKKNPQPGEPTHKWTVFVRSPEGHDLSYAVAKVVFTLHPTFPVPVRECLEPPYQVTESGWGEFDIGIKIVLRDPEAEPISLTHKLRFHQPPGVPTTVEVPRVAEAYDEVVFNELPRDAAAAAALAGGPTKPQPPYLWQEWFQMFSSESDLVKVQAARQYIQDRRVELEERLLRAQTEMARTRDELEVLGVL